MRVPVIQILATQIPATLIPAVVILAGGCSGTRHGIARTTVARGGADGGTRPRSPGGGSGTRRRPTGGADTRRSRGGRSAVPPAVARQRGHLLDVSKILSFLSPLRPIFSFLSPLLPLLAEIEARCRQLSHANVDITAMDLTHLPPSPAPSPTRSFLSPLLPLPAEVEARCRQLSHANVDIIAMDLACSHASLPHLRSHSLLSFFPLPARPFPPHPHRGLPLPSPRSLLSLPSPGGFLGLPSPRGVLSLASPGSTRSKQRQQWAQREEREEERWAVGEGQVIDEGEAFGEGEASEEAEVVGEVEAIEEGAEAQAGVSASQAQARARVEVGTEARTETRIEAQEAATMGQVGNRNAGECFCNDCYYHHSGSSERGAESGELMGARMSGRRSRTEVTSWSGEVGVWGRIKGTALRSGNLDLAISRLREFAFAHGYCHEGVQEGDGGYMAASCAGSGVAACMSNRSSKSKGGRMSSSKNKSSGGNLSSSGNKASSGGRMKEGLQQRGWGRVEGGSVESLDSLGSPSVRVADCATPHGLSVSMLKQDARDGQDGLKGVRGGDKEGGRDSSGGRAMRRDKLVEKREEEVRRVLSFTEGTAQEKRMSGAASLHPTAAAAAAADGPPTRLPSSVSSSGQVTTAKSSSLSSRQLSITTFSLSSPASSIPTGSHNLVHSTHLTYPDCFDCPEYLDNSVCPDCPDCLDYPEPPLSVCSTHSLPSTHSVTTAAGFSRSRTIRAAGLPPVELSRPALQPREGAAAVVAATRSGPLF
ncbi:unnamed protein product [Closterium sp. NIES-64]|nr:unnamed protein product [Closterium sp. NIES-64]